jgi:hypothetical protein
MPKDPKSLTPYNKNKFIYHSQSLKKTHGTKIINNYNRTVTKSIIEKPKDHWTENKKHLHWEYYVYILNQTTKAAVDFQKSQDWNQWKQIQKNQLLLENLINNSINLIPYTQEEIKNLNEEVNKNYNKNLQTGTTS